MDRRPGKGQSRLQTGRGSYCAVPFSDFFRGSWASWVCAGWCRCVGSDVRPEHMAQWIIRPTVNISRITSPDVGPVSPPSSISCSRLSILARPQSLMNWSCSIICQVMLCKVGRRSNSSPKRPLESY